MLKRSVSSCFAGLFMLSLLCAVAPAALIIEPVFNLVPGDGDGIPLGDIMQGPGQVFSYVSGDPRNLLLDTLPVTNTTPYTLTGFGLEIIGTGVDTDDPSTIVRGAPIDATFGDVDGDGQILSDMFSSYTISPDGRKIEFSGGTVLSGQRFTDIHLAVSDQAPEMAGIDSWFTGSITDAALCGAQNDPVASAPFNLVDAYCIAPFGDIGAPGAEPARVRGYGQFPANENGQLDVFVIWEPKVIDVDADEEFTYSVDLTWTSEKPAAVIKEWVGNFVGTPVAYNITNTSDGLPVELTKTATSATITNRTFDGSMFPGEIGRYHFQITGLEPGEIVTFSKLATGGHVVPEPASLTLCLAGFAAVMLGWGRTR
ncbi:MAG: hypothetical protein KDA92_08645 [Planctomycetales bacterium]|nr:hypothetical protein [Planctomycetales bacterium]MCA9167032.1 hypothetical protein [Planctomycetales bacterium]